MKKGLALVLSLCLVVVLFTVTGCSSDDGGVNKVGLGIVTSIAKSRDMAGETMARAQVDTTFAAVAFDKDGKIVSVQIDVAQVRVDFDEDMAVTNNRANLVPSKKQQQFSYGMLPRSEIKKEWFEQMAAFEEWMVGKTVEEVLALEVKVVDDAHQHVPNIPELTSSVTITVESYLAAVEKAWANAVEVDGKVATFGLGHISKINRSRDASETATAQAQADVTIAATAFDENNKVVRTIIDTAQTRVAFDADGKVTTSRTAEIMTKKELEDDYNMRRVSNIDAEWFEQIEAFEEWMIGKSIGEVLNLKVKVVDDAHQHVPDVPELTSTVTITVEGYTEAVNRSYRNRK